MGIREAGDATALRPQRRIEYDAWGAGMEFWKAPWLHDTQYGVRSFPRRAPRSSREVHLGLPPPDLPGFLLSSPRGRPHALLKGRWLRCRPALRRRPSGTRRVFRPVAHCAARGWRTGRSWRAAIDQREALGCPLTSLWN